METQYSLDLREQNEDSYEDLLVSIEASEGMLSLLIAVCDDSEFRERIIERYAAELQPNIRPYRVTLARGEPSLKAAIAELVQGDEYLRSGGRAVLTVTGVEKLYFLKLGAQRSEQEIFFGYLQWTREGMREFPFPIVLWMTNQIQRELSKKAPDFWSWRKGVFRFVSKKTGAIPSREFAKLPFAPDERKLLGLDNDDSKFLPLQDLQELIQQTEQKRGRKDSSLATLYARMGQIYTRRLAQAESQDYQAELALAIEYYRKAVDLQQELGLEEDLSSTLNNLANLYYAQGRYEQAEPLYLQALELYKRLLGDNHPDVAMSLNNLAGLYEAQGRYEQAEPLYLQALELYKRLLGDNHPHVATSLNNLAYLYRAQGRYEQAEPLYLQAVEIAERTLGSNHPNTVTIRENLQILRSDSEALLLTADRAQHTDEGEFTS